MKFFALSCIFATLVLVHEVRGQGDEDAVETGRPDSLWGKLKRMVKEFVSSVRGIWKQLEKEIESRSVEIRNWTQETFRAFKQKMFEFVDDLSGASNSEKDDMRHFIEKMEMPKNDQRK